MFSARLSVLSVALLSGACSDETWLPPAAIRAGYDNVYEALIGKSSYWRCDTVERAPDGLVFFSRLPKRQCYDYGEPKRYTGIFVQEFEGDRFIEQASPKPPYVAKDRVWLSLDEKSDLSEAAQLTVDTEKSHIWSVTFIGRKTKRSARYGYGHMGMSEADLLVDKMISANLLQTFEGYVPEGVVSYPPRQLR